MNLLYFKNSQGQENDKKEFFNKLYRKYYRYVYKIIFSILKSDKHIDDTVQECFMKIWHSIDKLNVNDDEGCKAFISVVAKNTAINRYNKDKKSTSNFIKMDDNVLFATTSDKSADPAEIIINDANVNYIYGKIKELGETYRDVMLLKYKYHHTPEEISSITGMSLKTVYTKLSRGREILKSKLLEEGGKNNEE